MPPKNIYSKEEIITSALSIVRICGFEALTARSPAQALCCSTKPIFGLFASMQELACAVMEAAKAL